MSIEMDPRYIADEIARYVALVNTCRAVHLGALEVLHAD